VIEAGLMQLLAGNAALQALVGAAPNPRIFYGDAPPDIRQLPCITYALVGGSTEPSFDTTGILHQRVEINALAVQTDGVSSPGTIAAQIRDLVIAAVAGWQQKLGNGVQITGADLVNPGTDFATEDRIFRRMCEFRVHFTLPTS
jgi:hypothetical protein